MLLLYILIVRKGKFKLHMHSEKGHHSDEEKEETTYSLLL